MKEKTESIHKDNTGIIFMNADKISLPSLFSMLKFC